MPSGSDISRALKIFISYSRSDMVIADDLVSDLEGRGLIVLIDRRDLPFGEKWQKVLAEFILEADVVVWLVSPRSIGSEWCQWELEEVERLGKRLVPVVVGEVDRASLPKAIGAWHTLPVEGLYVPKQHLDALVAALTTDREWLKEYTRLIALAERWQSGGEPLRQLLRTEEIDRAYEVLRERPTTEAARQLLDRFLAAGRRYEQDNRDHLRRIAGRAFVKPAEEALEAGKPLASLRLIAAGALLADDLDLRLVPEFWPPAVRAIAENKALVVLRGHGDAVEHAAFSPDGSIVLTVSRDRTARLWDAYTGNQSAILQSPTGGIKNAFFTADGLRIVTLSFPSLTGPHDGLWGAELGTACLWDATTGQYQAQLSDRIGWPDCRQTVIQKKPFQLLDQEARKPILRSGPHLLSPDGIHVVHVSDDGFPFVSNTISGKEINLRETASEWVLQARFSADGSKIVTAHDNGVARVWSVQSSSMSTEFHLKDEAVIGFSSNAKHVITLTSAGTVSLWCAERGTRTKAISTGMKDIVDVALNTDEDRLLVSQPTTNSLFHTETDRKLATFEVKRRLQLSGRDRSTTAFASDGRRFVTASSDGVVRLWDAVRGTEVASFTEHENPGLSFSLGVIGAGFSPNGQRILSWSDDKTAIIWSAECQRTMMTLRANGWLSSVAFSWDGQQVAAASRDGVAWVWEVDTGIEKARLKIDSTADTGAATKITNAIFSPDGRRIITVGADYTASSWEAGTRRRLRTLKGHSEHIYDVSFSSDGNLLATASGDGSVRLWDANSGEQIQTVYATDISAENVRPVKSLEVMKAVFDRDNSTLIILTSKGTLTVWDIKQRRQIAHTKAENVQVSSCAFSADRRRVAFTTSGTSVAHVWDTDTGSIVKLIGHEDLVFSVDLSPDGNRVVTGGRDQAARVWDAETGKLILMLRASMGTVFGVAFSPNGKRVATASMDEIVRIWDVPESQVAYKDRANSLVASIACGKGLLTEGERSDLLLRDAPGNLFESAIKRVPQRAQDIFQTIASLQAPLHINCYQSPTVFAANSSLRPDVEFGPTPQERSPRARPGPRRFSWRALLGGRRKQ